MSSPACFFLVPGRPIQWALKTTLGPTGGPGPGQQLYGQQSWGHSCGCGRSSWRGARLRHQATSLTAEAGQKPGLVPRPPATPGMPAAQASVLRAPRVQRAVLQRGAALQGGRVPLQASRVFSRQVFPKCGEKFGSAPGAAAPPHPGNNPSWPCTAPQGHPALGAGEAAVAMVTRAGLSSLHQGGRGGWRAGSLCLHLVSHPHTYTLIDTHGQSRTHSYTLTGTRHSGTLRDTQRQSRTLTDSHTHIHTHILMHTDTRAHSRTFTHHEHARSRTLIHTQEHSHMDTYAHSQTFIQTYHEHSCTLRDTMHTHGHSCMWVLTRPRTHTFTHSCTFTHTFTYTRAHGHSRTHTRGRLCTLTDIHTHGYSHMDTHTHRHTLTRLQSGVTAGSSGPAQALGLGPCPPRPTQSPCQQPGPPYLAPPAHPGHPVGLLSPALDSPCPSTPLVPGGPPPCP